MAKGFAHPKHIKPCVLCKNWMGNADLEFKSIVMGFQFTKGVIGKCVAKNGGSPSSSYCGSCKYYEPSVEASRLL